MPCPEDNISNVASNAHTILLPLPSCYLSLGDRGDIDVSFRGELSRSLVFKLGPIMQLITFARPSQYRNYRYTKPHQTYKCIFGMYFKHLKKY